MSAFDINTTGISLTEGFVSDPKAFEPSNQQGFSQGINPAPQSPATIFDSNNYTDYKYNQQEYEIEIYLDNTGDFDQMSTNPKRYFLNPSAILGLNISETATDWVTNGTLSFMYLPEGSPVDTKTGQEQNTNIAGAIQNGQVLNSYQFRGDGFDLLRVMIAPKSVPTDNASSTSPSLEANKSNPNWTLSYVFSIYEVEDVNDIPAVKGPAAPYMKCLKLYFHDVRYQMLRTTNLEYSTANNSDNPQDRSMLTSKALAEVFNKALADPAQGGCLEFTIDETSQDWNVGSSRLFYTSPAQSSAYDDVKYIYSHHVSDKELKVPTGTKLKDLCLLHTKRASTHKLIQNIALTSLSDLFLKAGKESRSPGELQKEHFVVTGHTEYEKDTGRLLYRAPMGGNGTDVDFKSYKYGQIISYSYVDMSPDFNSSDFTTAPVYSVDIGRRVFNIEFKGNEVTTAKTAIAETYISELYKQQGIPNENLFLPTIHKTKKNLNVFPRFSLNGQDNEDGRLLRQKNTLHQLLYSGIFANACVCFKVLGLTLRQAGTFIGIDRTEGCEDNDYNNKLYGQWFVVKVDHLFEAGAYMNIIYAVKIHRFADQKEKFGGLIT